MNHKYKIIVIFTFFSLLLPLSGNNEYYSNEPYIVGEDGVIRMYINIIGHVKNPGTYFVYDGIDILSAISVAGGFLQGSNLKNVDIYGVNSGKNTYNLGNYINKIDSASSINVLPYDTIHIKEKTVSKMLTSSNLPYVILGILNVILTLDNKDD